MLFQAVIQATMKLARRTLRPPPSKRDPAQGSDRTAFVWLVIIFFVLLTAILFSSFQSQ